MLLGRIQESAERFPDRIAVQIRENGEYRKFSYRELLSAILSVCNALNALGVKRSDRVAILSENRPEWIIAYLAITSLGAVAVPLDAQLTPKEVSMLLSDSGAKAVCFSSGTRHKVPAGDFLLIDFDADAGISFSKLTAEYQPQPLSAPPSDADIAAILYTSGTTGDPKGVMLSHGNIAANCASIISINMVDHTDNLLCLLPLHHTYPAMGCMILPLSVGATVTMLNSLKGPDILAAIQETGVTVVVAVPQLLAALRRAIFDEITKKPLLLRTIARFLLFFNRMLVHIMRVNMGKKFFSAVHAKFGQRFRLFASGGARLDPDVYNDMTDLGFMIIEGYGLTETAPVCTFNPLSRQKAGSIGMPLPGVDVRIANPDENGMGEIAVRGPNVMMGYYKKPEATADVIRDGWFYTGDLGYRDKDGYFFLTGRSKEMIVLPNGKKIFPDELEKVYKQLPSIKEFCLVETERGIEAAIVPDFDHLRKMNIANVRETIVFDVEDIAKDLPPYKRIMGIKIFKDSLPATRLGKLRRPLVRDLYLREGERAERTAQNGDSVLLGTEAGRKVLVCLSAFTNKKHIVPDDNLELDLGIDSLGRVEFVVSLEQTFGVVLPETFGSEVLTVRDVVTKIEQLSKGTASAGSRLRLSWSEILSQNLDEHTASAVITDRSAICRFGWRVARSLLKLIYLIYGRMSFCGVENLPPKGPYIIAPNHLSNADAPLLVSAMPPFLGEQTFFLGITKFFGGPITSRIARLIQVIPVDMDAKLHSALQLSAHVLREGKILCVFPEGSRSRDGNLKEFKRGAGILAKELKVPVVPVAITGTYQMLRAGRVFPRPTKVKVIFGRPISPEMMNPDEIVQKLHDEVAALLQKAQAYLC